MIELLVIGIFLLIIYACRNIISDFFALIGNIFSSAIRVFIIIMGSAVGLYLIGISVFALFDTLKTNPQTIINFITQIPPTVWFFLIGVVIYFFFGIKWYNQLSNIDKKILQIKEEIGQVKESIREVKSSENSENKIAIEQKVNSLYRREARLISELRELEKEKRKQK